MPPSLRSRASRPRPPSTALNTAAWVEASWVADEADRETGVAAGEPVASATANAPPPAATAAISRPAVHRRRRPRPKRPPPPEGPPPVGPLPAGPPSAQGPPPSPPAAGCGVVGV